MESLLLRAAVILQFLPSCGYTLLEVDSPTLTEVLQVQSKPSSFILIIQWNLSKADTIGITAVCLLVGGVILWRLLVYFR